MNHQRRDTLKASGSLGVLGLLAAAGLIKPELAQAAWNKGAFEAHKMDEALAAIGAGKPADSTDIQITAPDIAENGAVVPVGVVSNIPNTESIAIMIEKNPAMPRRHHCRRADAGQDGTDIRRVCRGQGRWQVLHDQERSQGHPRRLRRLITVKKSRR